MLWAGPRERPPRLLTESPTEGNPEVGGGTQQGTGRQTSSKVQLQGVHKWVGGGGGRGIRDK